MGLSAVYVIDLKGKVVISRRYRGDAPHNAPDRFGLVVIEGEDSNVKPVFEDNGVSYAFIKHNNLYFVGVTRVNTQIMMVFEFLYKLLHVFQEYFKEVEEESIRDNFVIVYELLDEVMDFGFPQTVESGVLQDYITQEYHKLDKKDAKLSAAVTGPVGWRSENIFYKKNEVYLDVVESVNLLVNSNGSLLRSEVLGALKMRVYLSGMPRLKIGFNDRILGAGANAGASGSRTRSVELEDIRFHQCVRSNTLDTNKTISFVPPDGEFDLMNYRLSTRVKPLIWVTSRVETHSHSAYEFVAKARSQFKERSTANNVEIVIPVPSDADTPKFQTNVGTVRYAPELDAVVWTIKNFPGNKEYIMRGRFGLPSVEAEEKEERRPIRVNFEIPYFTVSGLQVRYLKISEASGYQALPWVRYITVSGDYELRMQNPT